MYFNISKLKKIFKESWKSAYGLTVAHFSSGEYYIKGAGGAWKIKYNADCMPKEVKGALIELIGDLPDEDICVNAIEGEESQYEFIDTFSEIDSSFNYDKKSVTDYHCTPIYNTLHDLRYIRNIHKKEPVKAVPNRFVDVLSEKNLEELERYPYGPYRITTSPYFIFQNEKCTYLVYPAESGDNELESSIRCNLGEAFCSEE